VRTLVTGGSGFLGRWIVERLLARGDAVRVMQRSPAPALAARGVDVLQGDVEDPAEARAAVKNVDVVFHVAARVGLHGAWGELRRANVIGTRNLVDACLAERVGRLVYTSSTQVVADAGVIEGGDEDTPYATRWLSAYARSKAEAEQGVLAAHERGRLHTVALRPQLLWGPGDRGFVPRVVEASRTRRVERVGGADVRVSMSYVEDVAAAHVLAASAIESPWAAAGGRAYFVCDTEPVSLWGFIDGLLADLGLPPIEGAMSYAAAWRLGLALELAHRALGRRGEPRMTRPLAAAIGRSHWFKADRARRDLGWVPEVGPIEGRRRLLAWLGDGGLHTFRTFVDT
jgi:nucleoside-diphosphate-sugar epimerase